MRTDPLANCQWDCAIYHHHHVAIHFIVFRYEIDVNEKQG